MWIIYWVLFLLLEWQMLVVTWLLDFLLVPGELKWWHPYHFNSYLYPPPKRLNHQATLSTDILDVIKKDRTLIFMYTNIILLKSYQIRKQNGIEQLILFCCNQNVTLFQPFCSVILLVYQTSATFKPIYQTIPIRYPMLQ
jgi:hypothetical protein